MAVYENNSLTIHKGTDFEETFIVYEEDGSSIGINSSFSAVAKLRKHPKSISEYEFDVDFDAGNSAVIISMASTVTSQLPSGRCSFDVLMTYGFSEPTTKKIITGTIIVQDSTSL